MGPKGAEFGLGVGLDIRALLCTFVHRIGLNSVSGVLLTCNFQQCFERQFCNRQETHSVIAIYGSL